VYQLLIKVTEDVIKEFAEDNVKYLELRSTPKANPAKGSSSNKRF
jgi:hypothetical protein